MKIIITGSTGMIGGLVLTHCLNSNMIDSVISLVRKPSGQKHSKLTEVVISDFEDYTDYDNLFKEVDVAFFCLGVYTGQVADALFKKITVNYAVAFANALKRNSPQTSLCLLSGAGADKTEKSKIPFARYKGMAENKIEKLGLKFYTFRPGYIYPVTQRKEPNFGYSIFRLIYPLIKIFGKKYSIKSTELANAMFNIGINGAQQSIIENQDILKYKIID